MESEETSIYGHNKTSKKTETIKENEHIDNRQEIKISKEKINVIKKHILSAYLISFVILLLNSLFLDIDVSVEHSSKDYYSYSYWITNETSDFDFEGLFKLGSHSFESPLIVKVFGLDSSIGYEINSNRILQILLGNIPFVLFGNFILLTLLAALIYIARKRWIIFQKRYVIKIE